MPFNSIFFVPLQPHFRKIMRNRLLRIEISLYLLVISLCSYAQEIDDADDLESVGRGQDEIGGLDGLDGLNDFVPIRIGFDDILMIVGLVLACYVFGKIWRGCSYLLIIFAIIFYYITH